jgi:hypothetical protein
MSKLASYRDDFRVEIWLLIGAFLQTISFLVIGRLALLLTGALLAYQIGFFILQDQGILKSNVADNVHMGRWGTQIPLRDGTPSGGPGEEQVTVFILGARSNQ